MDFPQRKPNRLSGFDYSHPGAYFLTICTEDRKNLLSHIVGGGALDAPHTQLTPLGKVVEKHILSGNKIPGVYVDKFVVMPNHIHMILFVESPSGTAITTPANAVIPHFVSTFKRFCHQSAGFPFFQRSYHDHIIRGEKDYQMIWQYIDSNPALWTKDCFYQEDIP